VFSLKNIRFCLFVPIGEPPHGCEECGAKFWRVTKLNNHRSKGCLNDQNAFVQDGGGEDIVAVC